MGRGALDQQVDVGTRAEQDDAGVRVLPCQLRQRSVVGLDGVDGYKEDVDGGRSVHRFFDCGDAACYFDAGVIRCFADATPPQDVRLNDE